MRIAILFQHIESMSSIIIYGQEFQIDPLWQLIVTIMIPTLGVLIPIIIYFWQRQIKEVSYVYSVTPLLRHEKEVIGRLQIFFENKPVEKVSLVLVKIINSGNAPIKAEDYEREITLSFGEKAQVLTCSVEETEPKDLRIPTVIEGNKVRLEKVLFNRRDWAKLKILVNNYEKFDIEGRIVGVKTIKNLKQTRGEIYVSIMILIAYVIVLMYPYYPIPVLREVIATIVLSFGMFYLSKRVKIKSL